MKITVTDMSHDYSLMLRFSVLNNAIMGYWFDIVDNTELSF